MCPVAKPRLKWVKHNGGLVFCQVITGKKYLMYFHGATFNFGLGFSCVQHTFYSIIVKPVFRILFSCLIMLIEFIISVIKNHHYFMCDVLFLIGATLCNDVSHGFHIVVINPNLFPVIISFHCHWHGQEGLGLI